jgi:hypothetical protein
MRVKMLCFIELPAAAMHDRRGFWSDDPIECPMRREFCPFAT